MSRPLPRALLPYDSCTPPVPSGPTISLPRLRQRLCSTPRDSPTPPVSFPPAQDACLAHADVLAFNDYPGWYAGSLSTAASVWRDHAAWAKAHYPAKPFLISETGAGALWEWSDNTSTAVTPGRRASEGRVESAGSAEDQRRRLLLGSAGAERALTTELGGGETRAGIPPRWSQGYQTLLVLEDLSAGFDDDNVSGIALWQLTDIKADDDANRVRALRPGLGASLGGAVGADASFRAARGRS